MGVDSQKVGQSFRDILHEQYRSSTKAKKSRRRKAQVVLGTEIQNWFHTYHIIRESLEELLEEWDRVSGRTRTSPFTLEETLTAANRQLLDRIKRGDLSNIPGLDRMMALESSDHQAAEVAANNESKEDMVEEREDQEKLGAPEAIVSCAAAKSNDQEEFVSCPRPPPTGHGACFEPGTLKDSWEESKAEENNIIFDEIDKNTIVPMEVEMFSNVAKRSNCSEDDEEERKDMACPPLTLSLSRSLTFAKRSSSGGLKAVEQDLFAFAGVVAMEDKDEAKMDDAEMESAAFAMAEIVGNLEGYYDVSFDLSNEEDAHEDGHLARQVDERSNDGDEEEGKIPAAVATHAVARSAQVVDVEGLLPDDKAPAVVDMAELLLLPEALVSSFPSTPEHYMDDLNSCDVSVQTTLACEEYFSD